MSIQRAPMLFQEITILYFKMSKVNDNFEVKIFYQ